MTSPEAYPVGAPVDPTPAPRPQRVSLEGRHVRIVPFDLAAYGGFLRLAREVSGAGTLTELAQAEPGAELNRFFAPFARGSQS